MSLQGQLIRCPYCIVPLGRSGSPAGRLDPEENICPKCGKKFSAAEALFEDYPKRGRKK